MTRNYSNVLSSHFVCLCQASVYFCVMKSAANCDTFNALGKPVYSV